MYKDPLEYERETEEHREEPEALQKKIKDLEDEHANKAEVLKGQIVQVRNNIDNVKKLVEKLKDNLTKKNEELTKKDKDFEEREKEIKSKAYGNILYNVWLEHLDLDYSFLGPVMTTWIDDF
ncbi:hypothetical protein ACOSP7_019017 [Xanthoceras sorbifolium]